MVEEPDKPLRQDKASSDPSASEAAKNAKERRPDQAAFERKVRELDGEIYAAKGALSRLRVDALPEAIRQSCLSRLHFLEQHRCQLHDEKHKLISELTALDAEVKALVEEQSKLRLRVRFTTEEELAQALEPLQGKLAHGAITLREEKHLIASIRELELMKPLLCQYSSRAQQLAAKRAEHAAIKRRVVGLWEQINVVKAQYDEEDRKLHSCRLVGDSEGPALKARLEALEIEKAALVKKHEEQLKEYRDWRKLMRLAEIMKKHLPHNSEECAPHPLSDEMLKCNLTIEVLKRHLPPPPAEPVRSPRKELVFAEGEELVLDKRVRERQEGQSFYKPAQKKKQRRRPVQPAPVPLSLEMVAYLSGLRIRVPANVAELPATLEALRRRKEDLESARCAKADREDVASESTASPSTGAV